MLRLILRKQYSTKSDFHPHSTIKYLNKTGSVPKKKPKVTVQKEVIPVQAKKDEYRENEMKIQMISKSLYQQIFGDEAQYSKIHEDVIKK